MSTIETYPDRTAWLAARRSGIGGSDAPAALGVCPWKGRFALWSEKVGLLDSPDMSSRAEVRWGDRLQEAIVAGYGEDSGRTVRPEPRFVIRRSATMAFMFATLDAWQLDPQRGEGLLEIKTTGLHHAKDWEDEPPLHYQVHLQHQLAVTGVAWGTLAVLIGGQQLRWFDADANDRFLHRLVEQEAEFWRLVETQQPPEADGAESTARSLARLYPADNGEAVVLPSGFADLDAELAALKAHLKTAEARKAELENRIKAAMGNATTAIVPGGATYTYKLQTNTYPAKAACETSFRVLRRKEPKA